MNNNRLARIASRSHKNVVTDMAWLVGSALAAFGLVMAASVLA